MSSNATGGSRPFFGVLLCLCTVMIAGGSSDFALGAKLEDVDPADVACCQQRGPLFWYGSDSTMPLEQLVSYFAPVLWFSPDEPLLRGAEGKEVTIPEPFPFEEDPGRPVVYYGVRTVIEVGDAEGPAFEADAENAGRSIVHLDRLAGLEIDFFFYYSSEEGLNAHQHDVESLQVKIVTWKREECPECPRSLILGRAVGKAHGVLWYDNTLISDTEVNMPLHVLVEEAKHASCPDKNGDGYYTPGYDVNIRVNDAWGIRDIISSGGLFSPGFEAWMAKVRRPEHRVFPPLPADSPVRAKLSEDGAYASDNAIYELRPFPSPDLAGPDLVHFLDDKQDPKGPKVHQQGASEILRDWVNTESFVKSLALAIRYDGNLGFSFTFPLLVLKTVQDPIGGGWFVNRIFFRDKGLRDFGWTLLYTPSASRWYDPYFAAGVLSDEEDTADGGTVVRNDFIIETGLKFRVNMSHGFRLLTKLGTDFWGLRLGVLYRNAFEIDQLTYVVEFGAGSF